MNKKYKFLVALIVIFSTLLALFLVIKEPRSNDLVVEVNISDELRQEIEGRKQALIEEAESTGDKANYRDIGLLEEQLGNLGSAKRYYEEYLKEYPSNRVALQNYANLLYEMGEYNEAEIVYENIIRSYGMNISIFMRLVDSIEAQNQDGSRTEELIRILEQAVASSGQTNYLMRKLSEVYESLGDCDMAIKHLEILRDGTESAEVGDINKDIEDIKTRCGN